MRRMGCVIQDVIERQRAVPLERLSDALDGAANHGVDDADLEYVAAARSFHHLTIDVAGDETSAIEYRLRALERAGHRGLDEQAVSERVRGFELNEQRIALVYVADPPDAGARGAEGGLDEKRVGPLGREFIRRANDFGGGLRHFQARQQACEAGLALNLFERLEIGERYSETGWELLARGGKQISLLMHRNQRIDMSGLCDFNHRRQITIRIGAGRGSPMHPSHEPREAPKAHRIARDQFDPVAAKPQCRDGLARRQAGALAEKNFRLLSCHSSAAPARTLSSLGREHKATGEVSAPGLSPHRTCHSVVWNSLLLKVLNRTSSAGKRADPGCLADFTGQTPSAKRTLRFGFRGCNVSEAIRRHRFTAAVQSAQARSARPLRDEWR